MQRSQHGINSVPKYKLLHCVNLSEQTKTLLCSKGRNTVTAADMCVRYCLYTPYNCCLRLLIDLQLPITVEVPTMYFTFNNHSVTLVCMEL